MSGTNDFIMSSGLWAYGESGKLSLIHIPEEILEKILSYLTYHELTEARMVNQTFNKLCQTLLNQGFARIDKFHAQIQKHVKSKLPRRESERRNHPLARHVDILSAIETRLSLLGMTYMKYIDTGLCCFIPGKVLDELYKLLRTLQSNNQPPRAHEFLQELRDISSMAMEHFEEKIAFILKQQMPPLPLQFPFTEACASPEPQPGPSSTLLPLTSGSMLCSSYMPRDLVRIQNQLRVQTILMQMYRRESLDCKKNLSEHLKKFVQLEKRLLEQMRKEKEQERKMQEQIKLISEQSDSLNKQDRKISDLSKKILEFDQKFADIASEISKMKCESETAQKGTETSRSKCDDILQTVKTKKKGTKRKAQEAATEDVPLLSRKKV